jgi:transcriptional regulator with XRE-family HTH domain
MDNYIEISGRIVHIRTMLKTSSELVQDLADRIRVRRLAMDLPQQEAAQRSGIAYRTWRRLETEGKASIEDLIKAAIALRCEEALEALFPAPAANSLNELLKRQTTGPGGAMPRRSRATRRAGESS